MDLDRAIKAAEAACDAAGAVLRAKFRRELTSNMKPDKTIVTEADAAAERAIRDVLVAAFPDHLVTGEELPPEGVAGRYEWVLDPIDGTIAFACGKAQFSSLIALLEDGVPILGVIDQPHSGERWIGARGRATTYNGEPCATSRVAVLGEARLSTTDPYLFAPDDLRMFERLRKAARITSYGGDGYAYGLLASGHLDVIFETGLSRHDIAALVPVLFGAGAAACDAAGVSYEGRTIGEGKFSLLAAANPGLLAAALEISPA
jgi:histidinol phosphatase-like enzyme (inositol monophosphatase family)